MEKFQPIFEQLDQLGGREDDDGDDDQAQRRKKHPAETIKEELDAFLQELPILGFNLGK